MGESLANLMPAVIKDILYYVVSEKSKTRGEEGRIFHKFFLDSSPHLFGVLFHS